MKKQIYNLYMPLTEYVPDGEPHVFVGRVYVYGSHEEAGGSTYCSLPYTVWNAPVDDLTNWRNNGVSYTVEQDPHVHPTAVRCTPPTACRARMGGTISTTASPVRRASAATGDPSAWLSAMGVQRGGQFYLTNLAGGTWVGYKYFNVTGTKAITQKYRCKGAISVGTAFAMGAAPQELTLLPMCDGWQTVPPASGFPVGYCAAVSIFCGQGLRRNAGIDTGMRNFV